MQLEESVTLFDDNKVENRFAELQITADGITSEVSRKVGNNEVISRINQSAEAVTIQANKINIDGAITAINNNTTTTINGGKITTGTLDGDRIIANTINGNRIIADTLSAHAIKADSGQFDTANIPDLNAEKITSGTIDTARLNANEIKSQIVQTTELNASKIASGTLNTARLNANEIKTQIVQTTELNANKITSGTINAARINAIGASSGAHASLTSTGLDISNGGTSLASFGTGGMRVGKEGEQRITVTSDTMAVYDVDGSNPFTVSTEGSLQTANNLWTNWVSGTSGSTYSRTANIYLKGNVENNRFYVAVSTSGEPTTFTQYIDNPTTTLKTLAINGVTFGIKKIVGGGVFLSMTSTTSTKKYAAFKWTEKYRVTAVKINDQVLSTRSQYASLIDSNGTSGAGTIYTYGNIAMLRLEVYKANVGSGGTIYQGRLLHHLPVTTVNLVSRYGGACLGGIGSDGTVVLYNYTGATINPSASSPVVICATYIFK